MRRLTPWVIATSALIGFIATLRFNCEEISATLAAIYVLGYVIPHMLASYFLAKQLFDPDDHDRKVCLCLASTVYFMLLCAAMKFAGWYAFVFGSPILFLVFAFFLIIFEGMAGLIDKESEIQDDHYHPPGS